ncbi:Bifunctional NAD(P)H-hydrate repair enzyme Nnr [Flavimaricola marinus]|uniref:Bifunctional NAD(P)H-hydrate repair enzyme n=2 Tax=Flavimaricola marinus TaxID=1819565 RepID=A0A238LHN5_9RHOB|nr:Bifunctional NAD(P)H-hydrate repair enzyme Nnr [Flavimaricola marinus]
MKIQGDPGMTTLLSAAQMRAIETEAIATGAVSGLTLMQRAGQGVVDAVLARWPDLATAPGQVLVLCGPGNNGGDGFVIARLLHDLGWRVEVCLLGDPARMPPDARRMYDRWSEAGPTRRFGEWAEGASGEAPALIVDALFGTGLARRLSDDVMTVLSGVANMRGRSERAIPVVAVDMPSGLCADSGRSLGATLRCDLTVIFHRAKRGHYLAEGPSFCGEVGIVDIGLAQEEPTSEQAVGLVEPPDSSLLGKSNGHKFDHGHAWLLSGGVGRGGAVRLAARAALRAGAGLVTVGCPLAALAEDAARLDAIMLHPVPDGASWADILDDRRVVSVCVGPGLGTTSRESDLVRATLTAPARTRPGGSEPEPLAVCLDADALTLIAQDPALMKLLHAGCVLTPHGGEFARLFPDLADKLSGPATTGPAYSKVDAVRDAAKRAGCTILLKGPDTVIADQTGACAIHSAQYHDAAPWLATAGSGDVLAGIVTGLLARGFSTIEAAKVGAWLHAACARRFGPGLIAEDLAEQLPKVFRDLGL